MNAAANSGIPAFKALEIFILFLPDRRDFPRGLTFRKRAENLFLIFASKAAARQAAISALDRTTLAATSGVSFPLRDAPGGHALIVRIYDAASGAVLSIATAALRLRQRRGIS